MWGELTDFPILHATSEAVNDSVPSAYNRDMHIIAIGWIYVAGLMALTESNAVAGILTFLFYGFMPVALLFWISGSGKRRRRRRAQEQSKEALDKLASQPDGADAKQNQ